MKKGKLKAALLPLYLELYDDSFQELRPRINFFLSEIREQLKARGVELIELPVCRVKDEFDRAVKDAESEEAHAIITLHLAYSPSLESLDALAKTELPLIILDTTPTYSFGIEQSSEEIMYNHGIHGVQDICNMLIRNQKYFIIEAGHYEHSDVLNRVVDDIKAAKLYHNMRNSRTGIIGEPFNGMGDFYVEAETLKSSIGVTVVNENKNETNDLLKAVSQNDIDEEVERDCQRFETGGVDNGLHQESVRSGLALRRWIEKERLTAITVNFLDITGDDGLPVMPFLEISKLIGNGIGYAGEGDTLTASLVGALFSVFNEVTFTEMFCPDWEGNMIFMSHMGELNPELTHKKATMKSVEWRFSSANDPVLLTGCYKQGEGILVNLAPIGKGAYSMILAPLSVITEGEVSKFEGSIRGWIKSELQIDDFLERYSRLGGTHHSALVYNGKMNVLIGFAKMMGWQIHVLDNNSMK